MVEVVGVLLAPHSLDLKGKVRKCEVLREEGGRAGSSLAQLPPSTQLTWLERLSYLCVEGG